MKNKEVINSNIENAIILIDSVINSLYNRSISAEDIIKQLELAKKKLTTAEDFLDMESSDFYQ